MQTIQANPPKFEYTFHMPDTNGNLNMSLKYFWLNGKSDSLSTDVELTFPGTPDYYFSGFLSVQFALDHIFLEKVVY